MADIVLTQSIVEDEIVNKLDNKMRVTDVGAWANDTQELTLCGLKWLRLYDEFLEGYLVIDYVDENTILVQTEVPIYKGEILTIQRPLFFEGTPYNTISEWHNFVDANGQNREDTKLPFIWLKTPTRDDWYGFKSPMSRDSALEVFFVHYSDWGKLNEDRVNKVIQPLMQLVNEFQNTINKNRTAFAPLENRGRTKGYPKFGNETPNGIENAIFESTLGAVKLDIDITIKRGKCC